MKDVEEIEKAKNIRRAAKRALTRAINSARTLIAATRPPNEVLETLKDGSRSFSGKARRLYHVFDRRGIRRRGDLDGRLH